MKSYAYGCLDARLLDFGITLRWIMNMTASVVYRSEFLATDPEVRARFPALPDFLTSSGSAAS
jgi:hypothetical protein